MSGMEIMGFQTEDLESEPDETAPVAFIADTHDDPVVVERILEVIEAASVEQLVHLGDVCTPECLRRFAGYEVHWITGNGDIIYKDLLNDAIDEIGGEKHEYGDSMVFGTKRFYLRHGMDHDLSYMLARHGNYDYVLHGHWHHQERTDVGRGEVLNPGNDGVYLYYPSSDTFKWIEVGRGDDE